MARVAPEGSSPPSHMQNSRMTHRGPHFLPWIFLWHEVCTRLGWASGLGPDPPCSSRSVLQLIFACTKVTFRVDPKPGALQSGSGTAHSWAA